VAWRLAKLGEELDKALLVAVQQPDAELRWSAPRLGALALGWGTHVITLGVVLVAVLLATVAPLVIVVRAFLVLLLGLIAVAVFPRLPGLPRDAQTVDRSAAPALFALIDDVARVAGAQAPELVVIDNKFNAWAATVGWRRRRVLGIGRPLWVVLSPQQRVAVLGHEIGHLAGNDCRDGLIIGSAVRSLLQWHRLIAPMVSEDSVTFRAAASPGGAYEGAARYRVETAVGVALFDVVMALPRRLLVGYLGLLMLLSGRASQRAEYMADMLSAKVASPAAAASSIDRAYLFPVVETWMLRASRRTTPSGWQELVDEVESVPARQIERMRRVGRLRRQRVDETHPSNAARIEVLTALVDAAPAVTLSTTDDDAVLKEILVRRPSGVSAAARSVA
jgi:Zn-dependent protease with chaperone function